MACVGPCLPHCFRCPPAVALAAYAALAHALACVGYLLLTRDYGTPFLDSLSCAQRDLLRAAKAKRRDAYVAALLCALALLAATRPLTRTRRTA